MKGKATVLLRKAANSLVPERTIKKVAEQGVFFLCGMLFSQATIFERFSPFSASLVAACPYPNVFFASLGGIFGFLVTGSASKLRYLAAIIAIAAIRWTLNELKRLRDHPIFAPAAAFLPIAITGFAVLGYGNFTSKNVVMTLCESVLCGASAYFMTLSQRYLKNKRPEGSLCLPEFASTVFVFAVALLSFSPLHMYGISLGRVLAVLAILAFAQCMGITGGGISGTICGMVFTLSGGTDVPASLAYSFAGLAAGLFSSFGKLGCAAAFVITNAVAILCTEGGNPVITGLYEVMIGSVCFMLLPSAFFQKAADYLRPAASGAILQEDDAALMRRCVAMRLDYAAKALRQVTGSVNEVSRKLLKITTPNITSVYENAAKDVCKNCKNKMDCWGASYAFTMDALNGLTSSLRQKNAVTIDDFSMPFANKCNRLTLLSATINKLYEDFLSNEAAARRIRELRPIVESQFIGMSQLLSNLAEDYRYLHTFDRESSDKISAFLESRGIFPSDVICALDREGRMLVEIRTNHWPNTADKLKLAAECEAICGRSFSPPCVARLEAECHVSLCEQTALDVSYGCCQHTCDGNNLCGDHIEQFYDGHGHAVFLLSDGMGSGGRAAVDSSMASGMTAQLLQAGITPSCALQIVNSAMLVKSGDETLATLDIASVDLYSGKTALFKAGAPASYLRQNGRVSPIDIPSLPAGILQNVSFEKADLLLSAGDLLVLISDGVLSDGDEWLREEIKNWSGTPQALSEHLVSTSYNRRQDGHDDDITALCIRLQCK